MAIASDGVDVVGEVNMSETRFGQGQVELLEYQTGVLVQPRDLQTALIGEGRETRGKTSVLVPFGVDELFRARGKEERAIHDVRADDGFALRRLFHHWFL